MHLKFETDYKTILQKLDQVDPIAYGKTRNYIDGAVSYLSPYISRGVISTQQVLLHVLKKGYALEQISSFVKELCWRDYFQRVAQVKNVEEAIKQEQTPISNKEIATSIIKGTTGIKGIDNAIHELYTSGYMHNHCRMYTASVACNIAKSHWWHPAQWMYYHLLDGDWASNACSWQWVAAANSQKKYYANQENINKYTHTHQEQTFLDTSYEALEQLHTPDVLVPTERFDLPLKLPEQTPIHIDSKLPSFIYNYYNLDPLWHQEETGNRILLLEPAFFSKYPVSGLCIDFMLALSKNIQNIQIYIGSFESLVETYQLREIYYKEHPLNKHYTGQEETRDWIIADISGYYPSFFAYWKKMEKAIKLTYHDHR